MFKGIIWFLDFKLEVIEVHYVVDGKWFHKTHKHRNVIFV